jgi:hypothetical protein
MQHGCDIVQAAVRRGELPVPIAACDTVTVCSAAAARSMQHPNEWHLLPSALVSDPTLTHITAQLC